MDKRKRQEPKQEQKVTSGKTWRIRLVIETPNAEEEITMRDEIQTALADLFAEGDVLAKVRVTKVRIVTDDEPEGEKAETQDTEVKA